MAFTRRMRRWIRENGTRVPFSALGALVHGKAVNSVDTENDSRGWTPDVDNNEAGCPGTAQDRGLGSEAGGSRAASLFAVIEQLPDALEHLESTAVEMGLDELRRLGAAVACAQAGLEKTARLAEARVEALATIELEEAI